MTISDWQHDPANDPLRPRPATEWATEVLGQSAMASPAPVCKLDHHVDAWDVSSMLCALEDLGPSVSIRIDEDNLVRRSQTTTFPTSATSHRTVAAVATRHAYRNAGSGSIAWLDDAGDGAVLTVAATHRRDAIRTRDALVALAAQSSSTWRGQAITATTAGDEGWRHVTTPGSTPPPPSTATFLRRNLLLPLTNEELRTDIPRRGVLLEGAPGSGKTSALLWAAGQLAGEVTVLFVGPTTIAAPDGMRRAFAMANAAAPSLLALEDLDIAVGQRSLNPLGVGDLIEALDAHGTTPGAFVAATTCCASLLDPAFTQRPGRFDATYAFGPTPASSRRQLITDMAEGLGVRRDTDIDAVVAATDGWSLAEIADLALSARLASADTGEQPDLAAAAAWRAGTTPTHNLGAHDTAAVRAGYL